MSAPRRYPRYSAATPSFWGRPLLLALLAWVLASPALLAQTINVEAATRYWQLTDELRQNRPLTDEAWQAYTNLTGNQTYIRNTFHPDPRSPHSLARYRLAIETVYMPQHDSLCQAKLRAHEEPYVLVNDYKQREAEYRLYIEQTVQNPHYLALMYQLAYEYLPQQAHTKVPDLKLYYTAIGDGATSQVDGIFFSLKAVVDHDKPKAGIVEAHEMHHRLVPGKAFGPVAPADQSLLWALKAVRTEGVADLIDKTPARQAPGDPQRIQALFLDPAPRAVHRLDSVIRGRALGGAPAALGVYQQLFYAAGHSPGYFMARTIETTGGKPALLAQLDNPFAFFRLYQQAARRAATHPPRFSKATMRYLARLEKQYAHPASPAAPQT